VEIALEELERGFPFSFSMVTTTESDKKKEGRKWIFQASNDMERDRWISNLRTAASCDMFPSEEDDPSSSVKKSVSFKNQQKMDAVEGEFTRKVHSQFLHFFIFLYFREIAPPLQRSTKEEIPHHVRLLRRHLINVLKLFKQILNWQIFARGFL